MHGYLGRPPSVAELAVLRLIVIGLVNKTIADRLGISENTVKAHVTHLLRKLGATNRAELAARAVARGLVDAPPETAAPEEEGA